MIAIHKLRNLGWMALVLFTAILLYPLSLQVATLRSDLNSVDKEIVHTRKDIAYLEAELRARANYAQLQQWNEVLYGYEAPTASQYLANERELASLGGAEDATKPVLVSVADRLGGDAPAGIIGSVTPTAEDSKETKQRRRALARVEESEGEEAERERENNARTERMASMDSMLTGENVEARVASAGGVE